jgi:hypothetical protein
MVEAYCRLRLVDPAGSGWYGPVGGLVVLTSQNFFF